MFTKILFIILITIAIGQASPVVPEDRAERSASPQDFLGGLFKNLVPPASEANKDASAPNNSTSSDNNAANNGTSGDTNAPRGANNAGTADVGKMARGAALGFSKIAASAFKLFNA